MSIKCGRCKNKVFDSKAYLKISQMEQEQMKIVEECKEELNKVKLEKNQLERKISYRINFEHEKKILETIIKCKNCL